MQVTRFGYDDLERNDGVPPAAWRSRCLHHSTAGLLGVLGAEHLGAHVQRRIGMGDVGTALDGTAELAARHDLLAGIAAFLETHAIDRFVVEHLRHKGIHQGCAQRGHAARHLAPGPQCGVEKGASGQGLGGRGHPQCARLARCRRQAPRLQSQNRP
jgi:hypothetical protein